MILLARRRYDAVRRALCPAGGDDDRSCVATGLEGLWAALFLVSLCWFPLALCMCQAIKHAQQVRPRR